MAPAASTPALTGTYGVSDNIDLDSDIKSEKLGRVTCLLVTCARKSNISSSSQAAGYI